MRSFGNITVDHNAVFILGDEVFFNHYCSIDCKHYIEIGSHTIFGEGVRIYDANHKYDLMGIELKPTNVAPIKIGSHCWIGSNVVILKGVTIGDHSVIGAGCVIYQDIPPYSVVKNQQNLIISPIKE